MRSREEGSDLYILQLIEPQWTKRGQTGSQMNLNTNLIRRAEVSYPSDREERTAVAQVLLDIDCEISSLEQQLAKMSALKQAMAQALLTGRIRLVDGKPAENLELVHAG